MPLPGRDAPQIAQAAYEDASLSIDVSRSYPQRGFGEERDMAVPSMRGLEIVGGTPQPARSGSWTAWRSALTAPGS